MLRRQSHEYTRSPPQAGGPLSTWRAPSLPFNLDCCPGDEPVVAPIPQRATSPPDFWDAQQQPTPQQPTPSCSAPIASPRHSFSAGSAAAAGTSPGTAAAPVARGRGESFSVRELPFRLLLAAASSIDAIIAPVARAVFFAGPGAAGERFLCVCEIDGELSLVVDEATLNTLPQSAVCSRGTPWRAFEVEVGPDTIEQPGIASEAATRLASAGIPLAYLSTWRGDIVLVPESQRRRAYTALHPGITIRASSDAARASAAAATGALRTRASRRALCLTRLESQLSFAYVPPERLSRACCPLMRVLLAPAHERAGRVFSFCVYHAPTLATPPATMVRQTMMAARGAAVSMMADGGLSLVLDAACERIFDEDEAALAPAAGPLLDRIARRWKALEIEDPGNAGVDPSSVPALVQPVSRALADNDVPVFFLCTARTDYALVPADLSDKALRCLQGAFHIVAIGSSGQASPTPQPSTSVPVGLGLYSG
eukprot:m51a1_g1569 hypothetical protein (483) ;mRNA; f:66911-68359